MFLVGLTGGIASGKTLVSDAFAELGAAVIDADVLARQAVEPESEGLEKLQAHFGKSILNVDGTLNRSALRTLIFSDENHRATVDSILHPIIRRLSDEQITTAAQDNSPYTIYVVPLLVETHQQTRFDRILVVDVLVDVQLQRLTQRDGGSLEKAQAIIDAQASRDERLAVANDVITNSGTIEDVRQKVNELHLLYLALSQ